MSSVLSRTPNSSNRISTFPASIFDIQNVVDEREQLLSGGANLLQVQDELL
jgi:hypothetical protein